MVGVASYFCRFDCGSFRSNGNAPDTVRAGIVAIGAGRTDIGTDGSGGRCVDGFAWVQGENMRVGKFALPVLICFVAACGTTGSGTDETVAESTAGPVALGPRGAPEVTELPITPGSVQEFAEVIGDRVFFTVDRYDLTEAARATLERQAEWLRRYPGRNIIIQGHADERGTREYNLALGDRRANAVRNFLVAVGVDPNRVTTVSFGKEQPVATDPTEAAWAQNRRGVTVVD